MGRVSRDPMGPPPPKSGGTLQSRSRRVALATGFESAGAFMAGGTNPGRGTPGSRLRSSDIPRANSPAYLGTGVFPGGRLRPSSDRCARRGPCLPLYALPLGAPRPSVPFRCCGGARPGDSDARAGFIPPGGPPPPDRSTSVCPIQGKAQERTGVARAGDEVRPNGPPGADDFYQRPGERKTTGTASWEVTRWITRKHVW